MQGMLRFSITLLLALAVAPLTAVAANTPCSGKKGGIAGCDGDTFLCHDGSISASKRSCTAYLGRSGETRQVQPLLNNSANSCACGTGQYCTGPRGGVYCLTPGGRKSYQRK